MNSTFLLFSVFVISTCGLIYELIAGTVASYLLGDSITQFSTVIGAYLFAMGIGSWLSKYVEKDPLKTFVQVEILVGVVGGSSAALLFSLFGYVHSFRWLLYFLVGLIGIFVGIEIPLLLRILKDRFEFKDLVSKVLSFDYVGALAASILFPLVLLPQLGLVRTAFFFGILNVGVGLSLLLMLKPKPQWAKLYLPVAILALLSQIIGFVYSEKILAFGEAQAYPGNVIFAETTPYQRIVLTRMQDDYRLFLNGNLQFSSRDEYRYHEALVHPLLSSLAQKKRILVIGGGDGLAVREILKYAEVTEIILVDLDSEMTGLFSKNLLLRDLNKNSLNSPKLKIKNTDAFLWADSTTEKFDAIIVDLPDPSNYSVGKLYTDTFYKDLKKLLNENGGLVIQSTSPYFARRSFWCVVNTLEKVGFKTIPYHAYVPSFGEWGYVISSNTPITLAQNFPLELKFINGIVMEQALNFPLDMARVDTPIQRLNDQVLVSIFEDEWSKYIAQ